MRQLKEVYRGTKYIPGLAGKLVEFDAAGFAITHGITLEDLVPLERFLLPANLISGVAEESESTPIETTTEAPTTTTVKVTTTTTKKEASNTSKNNTKKGE